MQLFLYVLNCYFYYLGVIMNTKQMKIGRVLLTPIALVVLMQPVDLYSAGKKATADNILSLLHDSFRSLFPIDKNILTGNFDSKLHKTALNNWNQRVKEFGVIVKKLAPDYKTPLQSFLLNNQEITEALRDYFNYSINPAILAATRREGLQKMYFELSDLDFNELKKTKFKLDGLAEMSKKLMRIINEMSKMGSLSGQTASAQASIKKSTKQARSLLNGFSETLLKNMLQRISQSVKEIQEALAKS